MKERKEKVLIFFDKRLLNNLSNSGGLLSSTFFYFAAKWSFDAGVFFAPVYGVYSFNLFFHILCIRSKRARNIIIFKGDKMINELRKKYCTFMDLSNLKVFFMLPLCVWRFLHIPEK